MSSWLGYSFGVSFVLWLLFISQVKNEGKLNIKFIRYSSDGTDNNGFCSETWKGPPCNDTCDPMFTLCVKDPRDTKPCSLYYKPTAGMDTGSNNVVFGNSINGTPNPFIIDVDKSMPSSIKIQVTVYDYDQNNADDYMDTLAAFINISASPNKIMSPYKPCSLLSRTNLGIGVRAYCDPDWYGSDCLTYCKAQTTDYYSCQASSGAKICFQGWKGDYCNQDVDECTEMVDVCQHDGSCTNTPGGFQCQCVEGITGKNCELVTNHCALNKCLNGGICNGNETDFKCDCDFPWTGEKCDLNVDITNITVLGVINHNNKGSLITGLRKVINDLGGIQGQVNVVISTHIYSESINITTQVQFYVTLENDAFLTSDFVREIFSSHSDADINQYLPLPLYPARDTDDEEIGITTQENITEGSWFKSNWYKVVGALSAGLVLVALCVLFLMWRRKSHGSGQMLEDNQGNVIEMDVENRTVQDQHRRTSGCEEDARASTDGYTRLGAAAGHSSRQEAASYIQPFHDTLPGENRCSRLATPTPDNSNHATLGSCEKGSNDNTVIKEVNVDGATENLYEDVHI